MFSCNILTCAQDTTFHQRSIHTEDLTQLCQVQLKLLFLLSMKFFSLLKISTNNAYIFHIIFTEVIKTKHYIHKTDTVYIGMFSSHLQNILTSSMVSLEHCGNTTQSILYLFCYILSSLIIYCCPFGDILNNTVQYMILIM